MTGDVLHAPAAIRERFHAAHALHPSHAPQRDDRIIIEPGSFDDYKKLSAFHYKGGQRPGAIGTIMRMVQRRPTVVGRYLSRAGDVQLVGVLVRSLPPLCCGLRDIATGGRYRGLSQREAARVLNREVRILSRVIVDPRWRGLGLAVRLVRHALAHPEQGTLFTEALAAMARVSPFFEKAGMKRYERPSPRCRADKARLIDVFDYVGLNPAVLASRRLLQREAGSLSDSQRGFLDGELRRWRRSSGRVTKAEVAGFSLDDLLRAAGAELLAEPVYFIFGHEGRG